MDYCNWVQGFINFATSIPRNFSGGCIRCPCKKCKNKKYIHPDVVTMHLLHKGFMDDSLCWYAHRELFVRIERMVERMVGVACVRRRGDRPPPSSSVECLSWQI